MKKWPILSTFLALTLTVLSCGTGSSPYGPNSSKIVRDNGVMLTVSSSGQGTGILTFLIELKNGGTNPVSLQFSSGQAFDIAVSNGLGALVWKWSYDKYFTQAFWNLDLKPGDVDTRRGDWDLTANNGSQVPPGLYRVRVWITSYSPDPGLVVEFWMKI
jgi:hypothetical protein